MAYGMELRRCRVYNFNGGIGMTEYHYHDGLTPAKMENIFVYQLKIVYTNLYATHTGIADTHIHYYESSNGQILVELTDTLINHNLDIESIEITKV